MKNLNKYIVALALGTFMVSCAEQEIENYYVEKPDGLEPIEKLNEYGNIKDYVDRAKYPNFKIACALGADDYNKKGIAYRVANYNFDEITLGNAMKYASVVGDDGTMNFTTIKALLDNTEEAGMSVYGHTLAWHAQQNVTYLNSLLADAPVPIGPEDRIVDQETDFTQMSEFPFSIVNNFVPTITDGVLNANVTKKSHQFYIAENIPTVPGEEYEIQINWKGSRSAQLNMQFGEKNNTFKADIATDWSVAVVRVNATKDLSFILVDPGNLKINIDIASVSIGHYPPDHRPLTDQEKHDNLVGAINDWVYGMMEACDGRVKAWDLVNEAIGGEGNHNGYYELQHANGSKTDFFWQDYLGDEEFVPEFEKAARTAYAEYGGNPAELKLFANDYNLESDWDNNQKLKSLIYWVGEWEKRGAKIDGLSSQMHISYYENKNIMKSKADHMVNMLHLMANTGKLVRISELDMGYVDLEGNDVRTDAMTPEQLQNMANYYRFIIQMYLKIVPQAQQYSICQWCLTDAPSNSGWRANTPVGLWTQSWARKAAYASFCDAFTTELPATEDFFEFLNSAGLKHYVRE